MITINNPLSGNVPKWVLVAAIIVSLLIPTVIILTQGNYVGESETTSIKIHNPWIFHDHFQMDIVHEVKSSSWYRTWLYVPSGGQRYLNLTYHIWTDPPICEIIFHPDVSAGHFEEEDEFDWKNIMGSGVEVIVPYMPSGGCIGIIDVDYTEDYIDEFDDGGIILWVVVVFSAPEHRSWSIESAEIVLSNMFIEFDSPDMLVPLAKVLIETEVLTVLPEPAEPPP